MADAETNPKQTVVSRAAAIERGLTRYFTGKLCKRGHIAERYCSTHQCAECQLHHQAHYYASNPERYRAKSRQWAAANPSKVRAKHARYRDANLEKCKEACRASAKRHYQNNQQKCRDANREWSAKNKENMRRYSREWAKRNPINARSWREKNIERRREIAREWCKKNRGKANYTVALYRARLHRATPAWADIAKIKEIYREARMLTERTGEQHHVDHIYPLKSRQICGLHVHQNLRIIPARDNIRKSNKVLDL